MLTVSLSGWMALTGVGGGLGVGGGGTGGDVSVVYIYHLECIVFGHLLFVKGHFVSRARFTFTAHTGRCRVRSTGEKE